MKEIPLTKGKIAIVDDEDFEWLSQYNWVCDSTGRAACSLYLGGGRERPIRKTILMHRLIVGATDGEEVDHINLNPLDNRRSNLRKATRAQNEWNKPARGGASKYKGVSRFRDKWQASISYQRKQLYLGLFDTEEEAAHAYDLKAIELHGEFARTNFPLEEYYEATRTD